MCTKSSVNLCRLLSIFAAVGLLSGPAWGLVITTDYDLSDTEVSAGFQFWDNVGWRGTRTAYSDGSCVYLGDSWVLTANHVGQGDVILGGITYAAIEGTSQQIGSADARVFRIANPSPDLDPITIYDGPLTAGTNVRMFGTGRDQDPDRIHWRVNYTGGEYVWQECPPGQADATGYYWSHDPETRIKRWGTNEINNVFENAGRYYFSTSFDEGDTPYEANGADKDSGGAVFIDNGGSWELAGIIVGLSSWSGQPEAAVDWVNWSSDSGNYTTMVDLTHYLDEILAATPFPDPIPGDLNGDDYVGQPDLDIVLDSWGQLVGPDDPADPSGDGFVGQPDLDIVLDNWGSGTSPLGSPAPEPACVVILSLGFLAIGKRRRLVEKDD